METKNPRQRALAGASVSFGENTGSLTENHPEPQPASVHQLRALRLIGAHHVRPELAMTLAALAFGGAHG